MVMVHDENQLTHQGLHLYVTLPPGLIMTMLLHESPYILVNVGVCLGGPARLPLNFSLTPESYEVSGLICHLVCAPD